MKSFAAPATLVFTLSVFAVACSDSESGSGSDAGGDTGGVVTAFDGLYTVDLLRQNGITAQVCLTIENGEFSTSGVNSAGDSFDANGNVNEAGEIIVQADLDGMSVGVAATIDGEGSISGNYTLTAGSDIIGAGMLTGSLTDVCDIEPPAATQTNLSDHYGVRVTAPVGDSDAIAVTSYNVGLAPTFVALVEERLEPLQTAIAAHDADVICIQEAWVPAHRDAIVSAIASEYPYVYTEDGEQKFTDGGACTEAEILPMRECLESNCGELTGDAFTACAIDSCSATLFEINDANAVCGGAIIAQVGTDDIDAAFDALTEPVGLFAFDGTLGLILASRHELSDTQLLDFFDKSTSNHRAALFATVSIGGQDHYLGCTHLTANLAPNIPYSGPFDSWEEEGNAQAADLVAFAETYADGGALYLAGDFNCSVANSDTGVEEDFEGNCQIFLDDGYDSAAIDQLSCSFCEGNLLTAGDAGGGGEGNLLLDHVFTKNAAAIEDISAEIVFQQPINLED